MIKRDSRASQVIVNTQTRRMFLKSAAGYTLALPLLPSLLTVFGEKAMASESSPLRYVEFFTHFGGLQNKNWQGTKAPTGTFELFPGRNALVSPLTSLVGSDGISPTFNATFQNLFPYMNLITGADASVYWGHHRGAGTGAFAINRDGHPNLSDQFSMTGQIDIEYPSLDQVLAYAGGHGIYGSSLSGRRRTLNVSSSGFTPAWGRDDYSNTSTPVVGKDFINSTSGAFSYLFGTIPTSAAQPTSNPLLNLINEFWPSGKSLFRFLSGDDKNSLDNLFQLAQQASQDYTGSLPLCTDASVQPANTGTAWKDDGTSMRALADIIHMAFKCDITRVVTFAADDCLGLQFHPISHAPSASDPNAGQDDMVRIHQSFAQNFFGYLGEKMRTTVDPNDSGRSLLDNSLMLWTHEHKVAHDTMSIPTAMLGGAGGRINTGYMADLKDYSKVSTLTDVVGDKLYPGDLVNRVWASIFYAMGIPRSAYEVQRGNGVQSMSLNTGYGHVLKNIDGSYIAKWNYNLNSVGEPYAFMKKSTTSWG